MCVSPSVTAVHCFTLVNVWISGGYSKRLKCSALFLFVFEIVPATLALPRLGSGPCASQWSRQIRLSLTLKVFLLSPLYTSPPHVIENKSQTSCGYPHFQTGGQRRMVWSRPFAYNTACSEPSVPLDLLERSHLLSPSSGDLPCKGWLLRSISTSSNRHRHGRNQGGHWRSRSVDKSWYTPPITSVQG